MPLHDAKKLQYFQQLKRMWQFVRKAAPTTKYILLCHKKVEVRTANDILVLFRLSSVPDSRGVCSLVEEGGRQITSQCKQMWNDQQQENIDCEKQHVSIAGNMILRQGAAVKRSQNVRHLTLQTRTHMHHFNGRIPGEPSLPTKTAKANKPNP